MTLASHRRRARILLQDERYDFVVPPSRANRPGVLAFRALLDENATRIRAQPSRPDRRRALGMTPSVPAGGIVLCGGQSTRMGTSKALLPFGPETMLQRVVRLLGSVTSPLVAVAAPDQELPVLPVNVAITRDEREGRGPLEGLRAGLKALPAEVEAAYVTSCDVPLLVPKFVERMVELLGDHDIAVMEIDGFAHPLSAVYRRSTLPHIERLLAADRLRVSYLFDAVKTRRVQPAEMRIADSELLTLRNLNTPEDYREALAAAGLDHPR